MSTLLLRLAAPLQAWGSSSRFSNRTTEREPTKSGLVGLVAAALGRRRTDAIDDLVSLKYGIRIDQTGKLLRDFHTAHTFDGKQAFVSNRHYLADAVFVAGIESEHDDFLEEIEFAIKHPYFPLFLGRRSCPPTGRVSLGIQRNVSLFDVLTDLKRAPWQANPWYQKKMSAKVSLEIVIENDGEGNTLLRRDLPVSFDQTYRKYNYRNVMHILDGITFNNPEKRMAHDPMEVL